MSEAIRYHDGAGLQRVATIERSPGRDTLVLALQGGATRLPLSTSTRARGSVVSHHVPTVAAFAAYALLAWFQARRAPYGARAAFAVDGRVFVAVHQQHPPDSGHAAPHPGVTLLDATAAALDEPPGGRGGALLVLLAIALAAAVVASD